MPSLPTSSPLPAASAATPSAPVWTAVALTLLLLPGGAAAQTPVPGPAAASSAAPAPDPATAFFGTVLKGSGDMFKDSGEVLQHTGQQFMQQSNQFMQQGVATMGAGFGQMVGGTGDAAEAARSAATTITKLPMAGIRSGHERCGIAPNGAPDCVVAAQALCRAKGLAGGTSIDFITVENCPPQYRTARRDDIPAGVCTTEHYVTQALCQ